MFFRRPKERISSLHVEDMEVEVTRKSIKNIYLKVSPATGSIRVSAPLHASDRGIQQFIDSRKNWIEKQLSKKTRVGPTIQLKAQSGETHFFKGVPYTLNITEANAKPEVFLEGEGKLLLRVRPGSSKEKRLKALDDWYRAYLKAEIPRLIEQWEPIMGVEVKEFGVKKMKTRWGTCNIKAQRIWLSLELAKKSPECLEYVVVHEMVHLLERLHNKRFHGFMDQFLPDWRERKQQLNGRVC